MALLGDIENDHINRKKNKGDWLVPFTSSYCSATFSCWVTVADVRTQAMYQLLDSGFVGLTISCYSEDVYKVGRIQVIAFQSSDGGQNHMTRPIPLLSSVRTSSVIDLESPPSSSVDVSGSFSFLKAERPEQDSGDSKDGGRSLDLGVFFANADANYLGREKGGGNYLTNTSDTTIDVDPLDTSESMQEAMHRSNLDMR